jgi:hypothetical protein
MPCSFGLLPHPRSEPYAQPDRPLRVTVTIRWIPLVTAACGTRVARPARTTWLGPGGDSSRPAAGRGLSSVASHSSARVRGLAAGRVPVRPASDRRVPEPPSAASRSGDRPLARVHSGTRGLSDRPPPSAAPRSDRLATPKVAGQTTCLLMWSRRLTLPRRPRTCLICSVLSHQGALRRFRDVARNRWPLRGSSDCGR